MVAIGIGGERLDQRVTSLVAVVEVPSHGEVEVAGGAGPIAEPELDGHATLEDPSAGIGDIESHEEALEDGVAPESFEVNAGLARLVLEPVLQRGAQRLGSLVGHQSPP